MDDLSSRQPPVAEGRLLFSNGASCRLCFHDQPVRCGFELRILQYRLRRILQQDGLVASDALRDIDGALKVDPIALAQSCRHLDFVLTPKKMHLRSPCRLHFYESVIVYGWGRSVERFDIVTRI